MVNATPTEFQVLYTLLRSMLNNIFLSQMQTAKETVNEGKNNRKTFTVKLIECEAIQRAFNPMPFM